MGNGLYSIHNTEAEEQDVWLETEGRGRSLIWLRAEETDTGLDFCLCS
jgi:hypothetical protein